MAPWHDCEPCHSQPDGARLPLTRHPANGTSPPTRARSASEPLLLHAALTISPSAATAGPQHPLGVATAPCTQPNLLDQALTVSFHCLPSLVSPTWLHPFGGFGLRLRLRLVNLPSYSPDFNADEAIWNWVRQEVTANLCLGAKALVQEKVSGFFTQLSSRRDQVKRRCGTMRQARVEELRRTTQANSQRPTNVYPTLALVQERRRFGIPNAIPLGGVADGIDNRTGICYHL